MCYECDVLMKLTSGAGLSVKLELVYWKTLVTTLGSFSQKIVIFSPLTMKIQIHGESHYQNGDKKGEGKTRTSLKSFCWHSLVQFCLCRGSLCAVGFLAQCANDRICKIPFENRAILFSISCSEFFIGILRRAACVVKGFTGDRKSAIRAHLFRQFKLKAFRLLLHVEYFGWNFMQRRCETCSAALHLVK